MTFETILTPELITRYTEAGYWKNQVITDFLDEYAEKTPDKVAFIDPRSQLTYAELKDASERCALGLLELGVKPGDVVSFQLPNWIESIILHYAGTRIGAILNPLIPIYREREVEFMVGLAESKLLIVPTEFRHFDYVAMVDRMRHKLPSVEKLIVVDGEPGQGDMSWSQFMSTPWDQRRDRSELAGLRPDANDVTLLIFTSGTTGEPKGVMHTHNTLVSATYPLRERMKITSDTVFHMASTLAHLTGFLYGARLPVQNGASCVMQDVWDPVEFLGLVEKHKITYTSGATPFLHDVLTAPGLDERDISSLTMFCCMGAPIPRIMVREAKQHLPNLTVVGGWGQTENAMVTVGIPGDPEEKITETDGYPWPGMQVRVVDTEGNECPRRTEGGVQVKGPFLFVGYCKRMEMTRSNFAEDGWFNTQDLAIMDEDGYLHISGRTKDVIIRGGENIPVAYVENVMHEHPDVLAVAVVGAPDPRLQERACLFAVLKEGAPPLTMESLRTYLEEKGVAKPYWPERLEIIEDLPRTASGKIQKYKLREDLIAKAEASHS